MNQLLLVGVFIILIQNSSALNKFYSIEGGLSKEITFYCSTRHPEIWTYTNDQVMTYPLSYLNGVHNNSDVLRIFGITSQHEGVYRCYDNQNNIDFLNLTVLAVPKFIGCSAAQSCNLGQTLEIAEGQTLSINLTMEFVNGGNRGVRQRIQFLRFINSSTNIISCGNTCTNFTTRVIPYRDPTNPWILYANITDTQVSDSNVYSVVAALEDGLNSNVISAKITSILTIQVTSTTAITTSTVLVDSTTITISTTISSVISATRNTHTRGISSSDEFASYPTNTLTLDPVSSTPPSMSPTTTTTTTTNTSTAIVYPSNTTTTGLHLSDTSISSIAISPTGVVKQTIDFGLAVGLPLFAFMMAIVVVLILIAISILIYLWKLRSKSIGDTVPSSRKGSSSSSTSNGSETSNPPLYYNNEPIYATIPSNTSQQTLTQDSNIPANTHIQFLSSQCINHTIYNFSPSNDITLTDNSNSNIALV